MTDHAASLPEPQPVTQHDNKGFSEEKCIRCGWVMGRPPLNCNNDDTPHRFPSQLQTPMSPDPDLANAGRAALAVVMQNWDAHRYGTVADPEDIAQAVLDALGIKLDGWEWRATGEVRGFPFGSSAGEDHARRWAEKSGGKAQRRRKVTTEWEDAE